MGGVTIPVVPRIVSICCTTVPQNVHSVGDLSLVCFVGIIELILIVKSFPNLLSRNGTALDLDVIELEDLLTAGTRILTKAEILIGIAHSEDKGLFLPSAVGGATCGCGSLNVNTVDHSSLSDKTVTTTVTRRKIRVGSCHPLNTKVLRSIIAVSDLISQLISGVSLKQEKVSLRRVSGSVRSSGGNGGNTCILTKPCSAHSTAVVTVHKRAVLILLSAGSSQRNTTGGGAVKCKIQLYCIALPYSLIAYLIFRADSCRRRTGKRDCAERQQNCDSAQNADDFSDVPCHHKHSPLGNIMS